MRNAFRQKRVNAPAPRPSCTAWPLPSSSAGQPQQRGEHALHVVQLHTVGLVDAHRTLDPDAAQVQASARRRTRTSWPRAARAGGLLMADRRIAGVQRCRVSAPGRRHAELEDFAPSCPLALERPTRVGRAAGGQPEHRHAQLRRQAHGARRFAAVVRHAAQARRAAAQAGQVVELGVAIAVSRLPSRRHWAYTSHKPEAVGTQAQQPLRRSAGRPGLRPAAPTAAARTGCAGGRSTAPPPATPRRESCPASPAACAAPPPAAGLAAARVTRVPGRGNAASALAVVICAVCCRRPAAQLGQRLADARQFGRLVARHLAGSALRRRAVQPLRRDVRRVGLQHDGVVRQVAAPGGGSAARARRSSHRRNRA